MDADKTAVLRHLRRIPGVGIRSVPELRGRDPGELYERLCELQGLRIDRCMLYVFRCAVYFASHDHHDPELLQWWAWKDRASGWDG